MTQTDPAHDWSAVAEAWDKNVDYVESHTTEAMKLLIEAVAIRPGDRILELAAGPGNLAGMWSALTGTTGKVVVSDIAPGMVEAAARRSADLANVAVALIDASAIEFPDDAFDVVVCRMGLMFTPDPSIALGEIARVLGAGGRLGVLTWGALERNPWMTCVGMAAMANGLVAGGPPVGPGGIFSLGDAAFLRALAEGAGFADVAVDALGATFHSESIEAHVDRASSMAGPLAGAFAKATAEQIDAVRKTAATLAADYITSDGVNLPGQALLLTAHV